jgi:hypothetical protein
VSDDLPAIREVGRPARRDSLPPARSEAAPPTSASERRWGRRLLGAALLCAALGVGSCHALLLAAFG